MLVAKAVQQTWRDVEQKMNWCSALTGGLA
jgi:hypothetical protein